MARKKRSVLVGLNEHHRIAWNDPYNRICIVLANLGFSIETIANHTGLTKSQVAYRCRKKSLSVLDYRNGQSTRAVALLGRYEVHAKSKTG